MTKVTTQTNSGYWTPRKATDFAGFKSTTTVLRAFRRGLLPGHKLNARTIRFSPEAVRAWIEGTK